MLVLVSEVRAALRPEPLVQGPTLSPERQCQNGAKSKTPGWDPLETWWPVGTILTHIGDQKCSVWSGKSRLDFFPHILQWRVFHSA